MSFKAMAWASTQKTGSGTRKLVLLMLADRAGDNNKCYPSQNRLAEDCELSRDTIIRSIKQLEKDGFLTIIHRAKEGVKLPNVYLLGVVAQNDKGSSTKRHKPINEPINASMPTFEAFENLWKDYTLTFLAKQNRRGGSKIKAKDKYIALAKNIDTTKIREFVNKHAGYKIGHQDLERLLTLSNYKSEMGV